jgi:hypothetical protein
MKTAIKFLLPMVGVLLFVSFAPCQTASGDGGELK